ncbi:AAA family ATPase [Methylobacterium sp. D53M]
MRLRITGWKCRNIRGNLRDIDIDLSSSPPRWTLIQMNNGGGKTTTMSLIRAALTGRKLDADAVRGLRPEDGESVGLFQLRFLIDERLHVVTMNFDYQSGEHSFSTARASEADGGLLDAHALPREVRSLMTPDFAELFVFDGELARKIRSHSSDRASHAIRTLYGLDRLKALRETIERLLNDQQKRVAAVTQARDKRHVERLHKGLQAARQKLQALEARRAMIIGDRDDAIAERDRIIKEIGDRIGENEEAARELGALEEALRNANIVILTETNEIKVSVQSPFLSCPRALARLRTLAANLQALQLPETATAEFFQELADGERCVCNEEITPEIRERILAKAATYMAAEESGLINHMKTLIRTTEEEPARLDQPVATLVARIRERRRIKQELDAKHASYLAAGGQELADMKARADDRQRDIGSLESQLERLDTNDPAVQLHHGLGWEHNIPKCRAHTAECEERYNTATDTHKLLLQSRIAQKVLDNIEAEALNLLREKIRTATNVKLAQLVPAERLEVVRIGSALELSARNLARKDNVSEGQSLSIAYAFLASLFESANHRLPFIVDSPALPLDAEMRREVIKVVPELFEQTIMFVISTERQEFAEAFYGRHEARFITLVRGPHGMAEQREGEEAFRTFQDEDDAAPAAGVAA